MNDRHSILFVDDEENVLKAMKRLFLDEEYEILTATSGQAGLEVLRSAAPVEVIVSDYRMPGMSGVEFLREVHAHWPDTVRIVLSGYADIAAVIEAINEGHIYKFISKPWNDSEVKVAIANALERYQLYQQNARLMNQLKQSNKELQTLNGILAERITDEVAALRSENQDLAKCRDILCRLPLAVVQLDKDGWITYYNDETGRLFDWRGENMLCRTRERVFPRNLNALIDQACTGPSTASLDLNGRTVRVSRMRTDSAGNDEGLLLVFDAASGGDFSLKEAV
jgi:two-component system NtrC family sensor kinase